MFQFSFKTTVTVALIAAYSLGQENRNPRESSSAGPAPVYRFIVESGISAITYPYDSAPAKVDLRGTVLAPQARGEAMVQSQQGRTRIDAKFEKLPEPASFGSRSLVYVLWAITPEGGSRNLGEILPDASQRARLRALTGLQTLALIVTAEPYSGVRLPAA